LERKDLIQQVILDIALNNTPNEKYPFNWMLTEIETADFLGPWKGNP